MLGAGLAVGTATQCPALTQSLGADWTADSEYGELVQQLVGSKTVEALVTSVQMLSGEAPVGKDHLFTNLLKQGNVDDIHLFFDKERQEFHGLLALGKNVCGHPTIVHGGLTAAIIDESFGGLIFCMKRWKMLGPGPPFTKQLTVEYHKPLRAQTLVLCTTKVAKVDGRKVWVEAAVRDVKCMDVCYATGTALFVTPKMKVQQPWTIWAWAQSLMLVYGPSGRLPSQPSK